jgi:release factor glutamine methyltransferase
VFVQLKRKIAKELCSFGVEPPEARREAELITEHVTGLSLTRQITADKMSFLDAQQEKQLDAILARRSRREPLQYVLGHTIFRGLKLACRGGVFIPRSDTETVVAVALSLLPAPGRERLSALELGPGAGTICVSLLREREDLTVTAVEISQKAADLTEENAAAHGVISRLKIVRADIKDVLIAAHERFAMVVSNPPYINPAAKQSLQPEVGHWEPEEALFGGDQDGLATYRLLAAHAGKILLAGGWVVVEVGDGRADAVVNIFETSRWGSLRKHKDVHGLIRAVSAQALR